MSEKSSYLFVYGTLLDENNEFASFLKNDSLFYKKGKFKGKLYDIGEYPGAIFQPQSDTYIYGSVFIMIVPAAMLNVLDDYEGLGDAYPQSNEYIREVLDVETDDRTIKCYVYLYNGPVNNLRQIISGDYPGSKSNLR